MKISLIWPTLISCSFLTTGRLLADTQILNPPLARGVLFPEVTPEDSLGSGVAGIGDFNGDGYGDIVFGAAPYPLPNRLPSSVYVVLGRPDFPKVYDLAASPGTLRIATNFPNFGADVIAAGDVDGDALADFLVHQPFEKSTVPIDPRLYLIFGSKDFPAELDKDEIGVSVRGIVFTGGNPLLWAPGMSVVRSRSSFTYLITRARKMWMPW